MLKQYLTTHLLNNLPRPSLPWSTTPCSAKTEENNHVLTKFCVNKKKSYIKTSPTVTEQQSFIVLSQDTLWKIIQEKFKMKFLIMVCWMDIKFINFLCLSIKETFWKFSDFCGWISTVLCVSWKCGRCRYFMRKCARKLINSLF